MVILRYRKGSMKISPLFFMSILFYAVLGHAEERTVQSYIPKSETVTASVMIMQWPKNYEAVAEKFNRALEKNKEWFVGYAKKVKPGQALPYHAKFGITKEEYKMMLDDSHKVKLVEASTVDLSFVKQENGSIKIVSKLDLPVNNIVIDEKTGVTSEFGILKERSEVTNTDRNSPTGAWKGIQWKYESINEEKKEARSITFALGTLESTGQHILYLDVIDIDKDGPEHFDFILFYPTK